MKSWKYILFAVLILNLLNTCTEDFQLTEPFKDIPVVYGIIRRADTAQYIRIERAFEDENIAASDIAKVADSLYYPNLTVKIINLSKANKEYKLVRIDGNKEVRRLVFNNGNWDTTFYRRESGPFANTPNYLYKLLTKDTSILHGEDNLLLQIKRDSDSTPITSKIKLVDNIILTKPPDGTKQFKFFYESEYEFSWLNVTNASVFEMNARIYISEVNLADPSKNKNDTIVIPFGGNTQPLGQFSTNIKLDGSSFYNFFHDKLTPKAGVERHFDKVEFYLSAGGPEISSYQSILNANTGITSSQEIPRYSNIYDGTNQVFGIFSSVMTIVKTITPQDPTVDSLRSNPLTKDLNFVR